MMPLTTNDNDWVKDIRAGLTSQSSRLSMVRAQVKSYSYPDRTPLREELQRAESLIDEARQILFNLEN